MNTLADRDPERGRSTCCGTPTASSSSTGTWPPTRSCRGRRSTTTTRSRSAAMPDTTRDGTGRRCGCSTTPPSTRSSRSTPPTSWTRPRPRRAPGQQQLLHHQLDRAVPAALVGAAQLPDQSDRRRGLQEAAVLERLGAVRRRQHPVAGRQRVLGQLERADAPSPTGPGSTTTSSAAATGPSSRTWRACGRATTTRSSSPRSTSAGPTSRSTTSATATPTSPSSGTTRATATTRRASEGYSVYVNGPRAFTVDRLTRVVWDPATGAVMPRRGPGQTGEASGMRAPGTCTTTPGWSTCSPRPAWTSDRQGPNHAAAATTAVLRHRNGTDGPTRWTAPPSTSRSGARTGSPNAKDWLTVELGGEQAFDDVRVLLLRQLVERHRRGLPRAGRLHARGAAGR